MRKFINIDDSKFPLVVVRYHEFTPTPVEFRATQVEMEDFALNNRDYVIIIDLSHISFMPSEYRASQARWLKDNNPLFVKHNVKVVFCTPSSIARIMLKGVFLINEPGIPYAVVSSIEQGFAWGLKQLASN